MAKPTFPTAFSWKRGFLVNDSQRRNNRNAHKNDVPKRPSEVACLDATLAQNTDQRKIITGTALDRTAGANSQTTDPALLPVFTGSEATFLKNDLRRILTKTSATRAPPMSRESIPYTTEGFDESHIHRASPIRGLPPEATRHIHTTREEWPAEKSQKLERRYGISDAPTMVTSSANACSIRTGNGICHETSTGPTQHRRKEQNTDTPESRSLPTATLQQPAPLAPATVTPSPDFKDRRQLTKEAIAPSCRQIHLSNHEEGQLLTLMSVTSLSVRPMKASSPFLQRYDLRICLKQKSKPVLSEWEAFTTFLRQLAMLDDTLVLYPWKSADHTIHPAIHLSPEPSNFFDIPVYAPQLVSYTRMTNSTRHSSVLLGSSVPPASLVKELDPWLRCTKHGLWPRQLPLVEQTVCLGWLLFSAPEYNLEELRRAIWTATGVKVALRYRIIRDGLPVQATHLSPRTKAIHIDIDSSAPKNHRERISKVFSPKTKEFPVGIKMRLVAEISHLTDSKGHHKAEQRQVLQARFLAISTTQSLCVTVHPNYDKHHTIATLRKFLLHNPLPTPQEDHLFYAVSPATSMDKIIVRVLPQHRTKAETVISRLVSHLPGVNVSPKELQNLAQRIPSAPAPTTPSTVPPPQPVLMVNPFIANHQAALDKFFRLKFIISCDLFPTLKPQLFLFHSDPPPGNRTTGPFPSSHNLYQWLRALRQLFQNTAWDRWRFQIGVR